MNTRLQVEHPVTEMITGTDLVEWQLRVAAGLPLPLAQDQLALRGHAIEARLYAEQPEKGFLPAIGTLRHVELPPAVHFDTGLRAGSPAPVRIDGGVRQGDAITPHYDPMIAKLIVWGEDRAQALARLAKALGEVHIVGVATNAAFLKRLVEGESFRAARLDTGLIERDSAELLPPPSAAPVAALALASAALLHGEARAAQAAAPAGDPWGQADGWRLNGRLQRQLLFRDDFTAATGAQPYPVSIGYRDGGWQLGSGDLDEALQLRQADGPRLTVQLGAATLTGSVIREDQLFHVFTRGAYYALTWLDPLAHNARGDGPDGRLTAPMPGKIVALLAQPGQAVKRGEPLVIMEAMKMEHTIVAPADGQVEENLYQVGDQVADGAPLLVFAQHMTTPA
jgi:3-methylcrotonyl-CoA carboxylase alpha subunit